MSELEALERNRIIGENIRKYRLEKGLTQEEVATGLCSVAQLSKVETGKSSVKPALLKGIANRLSVSVEQLQSNGDGQEEVRELLEMSMNAMMANHVERSLEYARTAILKSKGKHLDLYIRAVWYENHALIRASRFWEAIERFEGVFAEQLPLDLIEQTCLYLELGRAHARVGNMEHAFSCYLKGEEIYQGIAEDLKDLDIMRITSGLARAHFEMRNYPTALRYIRVAKRLAVADEQLVFELYCTNIEANNLLSMGEREQAEQLYLHALEGFQKLTLIAHVATVQNNLGDLYLIYKEYGDAQQYFQRAFQNFELVDNRFGQCETLLNLAEVALRDGNTSKAQIHCDHVAAIHTRSAVGHMYLARMHRLLGRSFLAQGRWNTGLEEFEQSLQVYEEHRAYFEAYEVAIELANVLYERNEVRAVEFYRKAIFCDRKCGSFR